MNELIAFMLGVSVSCVAIGAWLATRPKRLRPRSWADIPKK